MKKILLALLAVTLLFATLSSCDIERKLDGVELKFKQKIDTATELSFSAHLKTDFDGEVNELDVSCYKSAGEYSYEFASPTNSTTRYRRLYADNKLYEFLEPESQYAGFYQVTEAVSIDDDMNFLRQVEKNIMLATYATLVLDGKKETENGAELYRYDLSVDGNTYTLWYDNENLVKIAAEINSGEGEEAKTDKYEATFTDYKFEGVSKTPFVRPALPNYIESPVEFENWMNILGDFSSMSKNWLK